MKILIVDDHKVVRDGVRYILQNQSNFDPVIHEAEDGEEAVEMAGHFSYDVIIMDINMPYMSGVEATSRIISLKKTQKILALSMFDEEVYISKMIEAGSSGYILKNSGADELLKAVKLVSRGQKYMSSEVELNLSKEKRIDSGQEKSILSKRELEIVKLIASEYTNREIAEKLSISKKTVDTHRNNILSKLHAKNTVSIVKYAIKNNLM
ncbi:MAG: response regulator transcription factor [Flavobacteriales bacterium]|nr:response regulator transcription factor [Flavobacteriales bacterium]